MEIFVCCLCNVKSETIKEAFSHSNTVHINELKSNNKYTITSCLLCSFSHSNPTVTKLHYEICHTTSNRHIGAPFITHKRYKTKFEAINEIETLEKLNRDFIKTFEQLEICAKKSVFTRFFRKNKMSSKYA